MESKVKTRVQDINEIKQSMIPHEFYFVLRGKRITQKEPYKPYIEASKKVDITKQVHLLAVQWLFNIKNNKCLFCGKESTHIQAITRKEDKEPVEVHLCKNCKIELI